MRVRTAALSLLSLGLFAGCDWSPPRDNPRDPGSSNYDAPPVIEEVRVETHCRMLMVDYCSLEIIADVYDREGISTLDSAWVYLQGNCLGEMGYDAIQDYFILALNENSDELPDRLGSYLGKDFVVRFKDDWGHTIADSARIAVIIRDYPQPVSPAKENRPDTVTTHRPCFQWLPYISDFDFLFRVDCYLDPFSYLLWDSCGIHSDCTGVCMGLDDSLANSVDSQVMYSWTVSVEDSAGNTATSRPYQFVVSAP